MSKNEKKENKKLCADCGDDDGEFQDPTDKTKFYCIDCWDNHKTTKVFEIEVKKLNDDDNDLCIVSLLEELLAEAYNRFDMIHLFEKYSNISFKVTEGTK